MLQIFHDTKTGAGTELDNHVATITMDFSQKTVKDIKISQKQFRFKCKRCSTLCCKLGGPIITEEEAKKIQQTGVDIKDFVEPPHKSNHKIVGTLKSNKDGSCVFLKFDPEQNVYKCGIYDQRPNLCKIYPFRFEKIGATKVAVKIIPCCLGLNSPEGLEVNAQFVTDVLIEPLLQTINLL